MEHKSIMVHCEVANGKLASIANELLGCASKIASELGQEVCALIMGSNIASVAQEAIALGANKVYVADDDQLENYQTELYIQVFENVITQIMPQVIILGQTDIGRDLAPSLAFRLGNPVAMDCIELNIEPSSKQLLFTRSVYGGKAQATLVFNSFPQIATVRAKTMEPLEFDNSRKGEVIVVNTQLNMEAVRTKILQRVGEEESGVRIEDASVLVVGGRGIGSADGFKQLEELALLLNGAVGASRPPCDNGWVSEKLQIGLTGKVIAPDIYFAIALSGSSQHMAGCSRSKNIVAINLDPQADIFNEACVGVVGDWKKVLPAFISRVRELINK